MRLFLTLVALAAFAVHVNAQSTLSSINDIFQTNCAIGCHTAASPSGNLILDTGGDLNALYANLVGVTPSNPEAAANGYKRIDPGYPTNSFLLRKCAYEAWDDTYDLPQQQGSSMPQGQPSLSKENVELIRQWILYGAPQSGQVVNPQTLYNYYHVNGKPRIARPAPPAEGEGHQLHMGPFFLNPGEEVEFYKKEKLMNAEELNVVTFESTFNDESHHYLLFQFDPGTDAAIAEGMRPVTVQNAFQDARYMVGWVDSDVTDLPAGTAYKIRQNGVLDLNYHLINYAANGDSVLAAEAYVNFYLADSPDMIQMYSELLINLQLLIFPGGQEQTFTNSKFCGSGGGDPGFCDVPGDSIYIWFLSSHTHKYGTDYDIYKRLPGGGKGEQLYEGFYNTTYDFNQGFYDWSHPGNRYFDELVPVAKNLGVLQETKFRINNPNQILPVSFGLTTDDEMMLAFIQYTMEPLPGNVSVNSLGVATGPLSVYPNPTEGNTSVSYDIDRTANVRLEVFNGMGQLVSTLANGTRSAGNHLHRFDISGHDSANGLYLIRLEVDGEAHTQRLLLNR
ncbi:MAG: T9SS type A sorting domain-containing protein [Flavobacteriales bacterium]|nr:T9SS type A sorting domain-containing protein [Flavobacteriales bacterium]